MNTIKSRLIKELHNIKNAGLYKNERIINSQQSTEISVNNKKVLNFCANNYLGLANNQTLIKAAKDGLDRWGFGLSSVRFICGTQSIHKILESFLDYRERLCHVIHVSIRHVRLCLIIMPDRRRDGSVEIIVLFTAS